MKKSYTAKKKAAITALSLVAICLAGGLFYYISNMGGQPPEVPAESTPSAETEVIVPEIKPEITPEVTQSSNTSEVTPSETPSTTQEPSALPATNETQDQVSKPSDGKPKSPSEAVPPSSPPPADAPKTEPKQEQPQGGEKRSDGAIYVPGFGWVEDSGEENETKTAPNAGTGDPVGDM